MVGSSADENGVYTVHKPQSLLGGSLQMSFLVLVSSVDSGISAGPVYAEGFVI